MQDIFRMYPEILFIDGTYKLLNIDMTVVILLVEDGNGFSEVVGVGILLGEDKENYKWMLEEFRKNNEEASQKVECIMSDKDIKERGVLSEVFPGTPLHICRFHTLQIFNRYLLGKNLTNEVRNKCRELLRKLVYSHSEENYFEIYTEFCKEAPQIITDYFVQNWHDIRNQWTDYGMTSKNLGNLTNNRLESLNGKLKAMIKKLNSLLDFEIGFFKWYESNNFEIDCKVLKSLLSKRFKLKIKDPSIFYALNQYEEFLTSHAYTLIQANLAHCKSVTFKNTYDKNKTCVTKFKTTEYISGIDKCQCPFWYRINLPCQHILATRNFFGESLFDISICDERWTKEYTLRNINSFVMDPADNTKSCTPTHLDYLASTTDPSHHESDSLKITNNSLKTKKILSIAEKKRIIAPILKDIELIVSSANRKDFDLHHGLLKNLRDRLARGEQPLIEKMNLTLGASFIQDSDESITTVDNVEMPKPISVRGRPRGLLATTPNKYVNKKKGKKKFDCFYHFISKYFWLL